MNIVFGARFQFKLIYVSKDIYIQIYMYIYKITVMFCFLDISSNFYTSMSHVIDFWFTFNWMLKSIYLDEVIARRHGVLERKQET